MDYKTQKAMIPLAGLRHWYAPASLHSSSSRVITVCFHLHRSGQIHILVNLRDDAVLFATAPGHLSSDVGSIRIEHDGAS